MTALVRELPLAGRQWRSTALVLCLLAGFAGLPVVSGCSGGSPQEHAAKSEARAAKLAAKSHERLEEDAAGKVLDAIRPPSKSAYLSVSHRSEYRNPFLVVHPGTVTLTVLSGMKSPHTVKAGSIARPMAPSHRQIEVRMEDLATALGSLPASDWPYGRVVAVEEGSGSHRQRVQIRRNIEATYKILNDLGVVIDEWDSAPGSPTR